MIQLEIDRAVAVATGDTLCDVRRMGFSIDDPNSVDIDPEPMEPVDELDRYIDWDAFDLLRNTAVIVQPRGVAAPVA